MTGGGGLRCRTLSVSASSSSAGARFGAVLIGRLGNDRRDQAVQQCGRTIELWWSGPPRTEPKSDLGSPAPPWRAIKRVITQLFRRGFRVAEGSSPEPQAISRTRRLLRASWVRALCLNWCRAAPPEASANIAANLAGQDHAAPPRLVAIRMPGGNALPLPCRTRCPRRNVRPARREDTCSLLGDLAFGIGRRPAASVSLAGA
jgi:hypothetical protein